VIFLEGKFSRKGDIDDIDRFFEVNESHEGALNLNQKNESNLLTSESVPSSTSVLLWTNFEATFLRRSQRENITHHRFEIEGKTFMCAPQETDEPKN